MRCGLILPVLLAAALILCGYTTLRIPPRQRPGKRRLACVGDSITYGCTLPLFFRYRYPAVLQQMLGDRVQVGVFGVNDRTLQDSGNKPIRREKAYGQSLAFRPDTVVIQLGTNDSKDSNWTSEEAFRQQYAELIREYRTRSGCRRVLLCTPPCAFPPRHRLFYLTNDARLERVPGIAALVRSIAEAEGAELVDLYARTEGKRELFGPDGLHPCAAGARAIAEEIFRVYTGKR